VKHVDVVVVGAGFGGLYAVFKLRQAGLSVQGFEAGADVGGTWFWNRYPGATVDVMTFDYSYSFSEELQQDWVWTHKYASQADVLRYLNHVADRFDLRRSFRFGTRVVSTRWEDDRKRWRIVLDTGEEISARFCVLATGVLSAWKFPELPGLQSFQGQSYHTAQWPVEGVDFSGKRVGIIGTGSSGVQAMPVIAKQAKDVFVFQRTPNFCFPANNRALNAGELDAVKAEYSDYRRRARETSIGMYWPMSERSALDDTPDERKKQYEAVWQAGNLMASMLAYKDILTSKEANDTFVEFIHEKIRQAVRDPAVAEDLCPVDHPVGTKRPILENGYYEAFNRDNVHLVNIRKDPIIAITGAGVRTGKQLYELDALVFATGFDAVTGSFLKVAVTGKNGRALRDHWEKGPRTFMGLTTSGFPNLFLLTGPLGPSVLGNLVNGNEQHVDWVADCIAYLDKNGFSAIEASPAAEQRWIEEVQEVVQQTLYPKANSWFIGANVPGKPRVFLAYLGGFSTYYGRLWDLARNRYENFILHRRSAD
jgi:cyclohexanone monooxygenase